MQKVWSEYTKKYTKILKTRLFSTQSRTGFRNFITVLLVLPIYLELNSYIYTEKQKKYMSSLNLLTANSSQLEKIKYIYVYRSKQ